MAFSNVSMSTSMWLFVSVCFCLSSSGLLDIESTVGLESVHDDTAKTMGLPGLVAYFAEVADVVDANASASASNDSTTPESFSNPMVVQSEPELELNVESEQKKKATKKFVYDVISRLLG